MDTSDLGVADLVVTAVLQRFRFGPAEWLWRCRTYRGRQPFRRLVGRWLSFREEQRCGE